MSTITHLIKTFTSHRHAELVSASMPQCLGQSGIIQSRAQSEAWVLKQVQDDSVGAFA
jgi:hypothetical protein